MSEEKNTKMPADFDMSFAEDLGVMSKKAETTNTSAHQNIPAPTNNVSANINEDLTHDHEAVNPQITDAVTQVNTEVLADAPELALGALYQTTGNPNELSDYVAPASETPTYNIYEDLTHDHHVPTNTIAPTKNLHTENTTSTDSLEGVVFDSEAQMDAHFDGHVSVSESENLTT